MRIVSTLLFAGFITAIAAPSDAPELAVDRETVSNAPTDNLDPIVTGVEISDEHKADWQKRRDAYLKCPECVASQPYPGD